MEEVAQGSVWVPFLEVLKALVGVALAIMVQVVDLALLT